MKKLYIVNTPIGNLEDMSPRGIRILGEVSLIAAEDTRVTGKLLSKFNIHTPQISFNTHNASRRIPLILKEMETGNVALTTDAGSPGVSDPGNELVNVADDNGIEVITIPGPSSLTAIMAISPFQSHRTYFYGFAPRGKSELEQLMAQCDLLRANCVLYESPNRLKKFLDTLGSVSPERQLVIGRELTKFHEERFVGTATSASKHFENPKGEFTILLKPQESLNSSFTTEDYKKVIGELQVNGVGIKEIAREISAMSGKTNSQAYRIVLDNI